MTADHDKGHLGFWMTWALVVGSMIGSGIFLLPVSLAPLGLNSVIGWLVSSFGALAIAFALATLSRSGGGGIQAYIERAFGRTVGFMVAWGFWCSNIAAQAALAIATASALARVSPFLASQQAIVLSGVGSVVVLTLVNLRGVRTVGGLSLITVAIKIIPLLAVIGILVARQAAGTPFEPFAATPITLSNIATATALTLFALTGFENVTTPVDKIHNATRTIPRALLTGTSFVALLYLMSSSGVMLLLPPSQIAGSPAPYADVIALEWNEGAALLVALGIAVSAFGALNGQILGTGELAYAMGLRGDLPKLVAKTRRGHVPYVAHIIGGIVTAALILSNSSKGSAGLFVFVSLLSASAVLFVYAVGALAAWKDDKRLTTRLVIAVALLFVAFAYYGSGLEADLWSLVLLAIGLAVRFIMHRLNSSAATPPAGAPAAPRD